MRRSTLVTGMVVASILSGCRKSGSGGGTAETLTRSTWVPGSPIQASPLPTLLERHPGADRVVPLGDRASDAWAEAGAMIVYNEQGGVALITDDGDLKVDRLPPLPQGCRPTDAATDLKDHVCMRVACGTGAVCITKGEQGWRPAAMVTELRGLASAPGAIVGWWDVGVGAVHLDTQSNVVVDQRPPASEVVATLDGGATWGSVAITPARENIEAVMFLGGTVAIYAAENNGQLQVHSALPQNGASQGDTTVMPGPRLDNAFSRLLASNGGVALLTQRSGGLEIRPGFPVSGVGARMTFLPQGAQAVAMWSAETLVASRNRDLITYQLADGSVRTWPEWIAQSPGNTLEAPVGQLPSAPLVLGSGSAVVGLGRVGRSLVIVTQDGNLLVYG